MSNFVLIYTGGSMPTTPAEQNQVLQDWTNWFTRLSAAVVDGGNPFTPAAKNIASNGKVSDGPVGVMATGYSIIKADSLAAATEIAKGCPHLQAGGGITIYEAINMA